MTAMLRVRISGTMLSKTDGHGVEAASTAWISYLGERLGGDCAGGRQQFMAKSQNMPHPRTL